MLVPAVHPIKQLLLSKIKPPQRVNSTSPNSIQHLMASPPLYEAQLLLLHRASSPIKVRRTEVISLVFNEIPPLVSCCCEFGKSRLGCRSRKKRHCKAKYQTIPQFSSSQLLELLEFGLILLNTPSPSCVEPKHPSNFP